MKFAGLILASVLTLSSNAFACGDEIPLLGLEMDCRSADGRRIEIDFDYSWAACSQSQTVSVKMDGGTLAFYKFGRQLVETADGDVRETWREDVMTRKTRDGKILIHLESKEESVVTDLVLKKTGETIVRNADLERDETLASYRGEVRFAAKNGSSLKQKISCRQRPIQK